MLEYWTPADSHQREHSIIYDRLSVETVQSSTITLSFGGVLQSDLLLVSVNVILDSGLGSRRYSEVCQLVCSEKDARSNLLSLILVKLRGSSLAVFSWTLLWN